MSDSCDPMDCSLPGCSVHGILQARILEWVAISFSRGSSSPRNRTQVSCTAGRVFTNWATREVPERWAPKNWYFWTVVLERLLRIPWTARRSNQSILKEISPQYSLGGLMLKLKLRYFCHLMQRTDSLEKTLVLGKRLKAEGEEDGRGWDGWMASPIQWTWVWESSRTQWRTGKPGTAVHRVAKSQRRLSDWTDWKITAFTSQVIWGLNELNHEK